jgi:hypothetical protein
MHKCEHCTAWIWTTAHRALATPSPHPPYATQPPPPKQFNQHVIIETNKTTERIFPAVPDVEHPDFFTRMDRLVELNGKVRGGWGDKGGKKGGGEGEKRGRYRHICMQYVSHDMLHGKVRGHGGWTWVPVCEQPLLKVCAVWTAWWSSTARCEGPGAVGRGWRGGAGGPFFERTCWK